MTDTESLTAPLRRALDLTLSLPAPHYGMDRAAVQGQIQEIAALVESRRRRKGPPLPRKADIAQLAELTGRDFSRQRQAILNLLQAWCEQAEQQARSAPPELCAALWAVASTETDAQALQTDANEAWRSFHCGAYKAAAVMAGAVLEGLGQQACVRLGETATAAFARLFPQRAAKPPLRYGVDEALAVLRECGLLSSALTHAGRGLKELRNFVHPDLARHHRRGLNSTHSLLALQALCALADELAFGLQSR